MKTPLPQTSRRAFLHRGALCLAGLETASLLAADETRKPALQAGLVTDLHYGDKPPAGTRFYRESLDKLTEAVKAFNTAKPDFVVELGDLMDKAASVDQETEWLQRIDKVYAGVKAPRHYVLGNHCVATLTKEEFAAHSSASRVPHYSFDAGPVHWVVLDACYMADGTPYARGNFDWKDSAIPPAEVEWLKADLAKAQKPVVIFAHQRLDDHGAHSIHNAAEVRTVLENSGKVLAAFQGHSHKNDYQQIAGIHYCTLVALIEGSGEANNGYGILDVMADGSLRLHGFRQQVDRMFEKKG